MTSARRGVNDEANLPISRERGCLCGHRESSHVLWKPQPCICCACKTFRYVRPGDLRLRKAFDRRMVE